MENRTVFNLNERIAAWRDSLQHSPAIRTEDLDELESHLRATVDSLRGDQLSEEEAFLIATRRIGNPMELEEEFGRAKPVTVWKTRAQWMVIGVMSYWVWANLAQLGSMGMLFVGGSFVKDGTTLGMIALAVQAIQTFLAFGLAWLAICTTQRTRKNVPTHIPKLGRFPMLNAMIVLSFTAIFLQLALRSLQIFAVQANPATAVGGFFAVTTWGNYALTTLAVIAFGLWLAKSSGSAKGVGRLAALLFLSGLLVTACKPNGAAPNSDTKSDVAVAAGTKLEECLKLMSSDANAAVDAFLALDLDRAELFSSGNALSYSELEFMKLPRPALEKMQKQALDDLNLIKNLARDARSRLQQAQAAGDSALAERYRAKLVKLGERLEGPENLKIAQLVGTAIKKMATP